MGYDDNINFSPSGGGAVFVGGDGVIPIVNISVNYGGTTITTVTPTVITTPTIPPTPPTPPPTPIPETQTALYNMVIRDGMRFLGGDYKLLNTGPKRPMRLNVEGNNGVWNGIQSLSEDNGYATCTPVTGEISTTLIASQFGFSLPSNATIIGIKVTVKRRKF